MAKAAGRLAVLSKNAVPIGGVRVTKIKYAGTSIDVTDRDSSGIIELLSVVATQQITLEVEGVVEDATLRDIAFDPAQSKMLSDLTFKFADAVALKDTIGGNFFFSDYEESNPHDDAADFTASFQSSGTWTLT